MHDIIVQDFKTKLEPPEPVNFPTAMIYFCAHINRTTAYFQLVAKLEIE